MKYTFTWIVTSDMFLTFPKSQPYSNTTTLQIYHIFILIPFPMKKPAFYGGLTNFR